MGDGDREVEVIATVAELSKEERKARVRVLKENELAGAIAAMPLKPQRLRQLINFVDGCLCHAGGCDRTLTFTRGFLESESFDVEKVIDWLRENGGGCDCEVVANLDDLSYDALARQRAPKVAPPQQQFERKERGQQPERSLATATGWDFSKLPAPWRVANRFKPEEPLQLEFGKRGRCGLILFEQALPRGDRATDEYWEKLFKTRARMLSGFRPDGPYQITRDTLNLPTGFTSIMVSGHYWRKIGWIMPEKGKWHLQFFTESIRDRTDLPQVEALMVHLTSRPV